MSNIDVTKVVDIKACTVVLHRHVLNRTYGVNVVFRKNGNRNAHTRAVGCGGEMGGQCQDFCYYFFNKKENHVHKHTRTRSTLTHARHGSETPKIVAHCGQGKSKGLGRVGIELCVNRVYRQYAPV